MRYGQKFEFQVGLWVQSGKMGFELGAGTNMDSNLADQSDNVC